MRACRRCARCRAPLPDADGLDDHSVEAERVEHVGDLARRRGESAERAARRHRADEDAGVERHALHADAIAEQRAAGERRRRIDGDDADRQPRVAEFAREHRGERALARARRSGDADAPRAPELRMQTPSSSSIPGRWFSTMLTARASAALFRFSKSARSFSVAAGKNPFLSLPHVRLRSRFVVGMIVSRDVQSAVHDEPRELPAQRFRHFALRSASRRQGRCRCRRPPAFPARPGPCRTRSHRSRLCASDTRHSFARSLVLPTNVTEIIALRIRSAASVASTRSRTFAAEIPGRRTVDDT